MKITIHRGTHQIGGTITEIQSEKARIFIDMGEELPNEDKPSSPIEIEGVTTSNVNCDAVFFTHNHGDHIGMFSRINKSIPLYLGEASKEIYLTLQKYLKSTHLNHLEQIITFKALDKISIKDITVTPLLVDHSAYDAYMFIIEADGKRVLHTGDFRNHGFKGKGLLKMLSVYAKDIDLLITEGTTLSSSLHPTLKESELKTKAEKLLNEKKYVFVLCSSTNIDRISAFYQANPHGKYFVCDEYQKDILGIVEKHGAKYTDLYQYNNMHTYNSKLVSRLKAQGFCMLVRNNPKFAKIMKLFDPTECLVIYSMWQGYLENKDNDLNGFLKDYQWTSLHTSGHASRETIQEVIKLLNPKRGVTPIHSENPESLSHLGLSSKIIILKDRECFEVI